MNRYIKEETMLSIPDLLRYYAKHCIKIVIAGILCVLLVSGLFVIRNRRTGITEPVLSETEVSSGEGVLYDLSAREQQQRDVENYLMEKSALQNAVNSFQEQIRKQNVYLTNSILMNLDPYHVVNSRVDIRVWVLEESKIQQLSTLLLYYKQLLNNGEYLSDLAKEFDIDQAYLKELIMITSTIPDYLDDVLQGGLSATNQDLLKAHLTEGSYGYIHIAVKGADAEWTEQVLDHVLNYLFALEKENSLGINQKLDEVDRFTVTGPDLDVRTAQSNTNQYNINLYNQLTTINNTINNLKQPADVVSAPPVTFSKRSLLKYMIFGGVIGVLFMLLLYGIKYLYDDSVSSYARISQRFYLNHLGSFKASDNTQKLNEAPTLEMICANVRIYSGENDRILLAGCTNESLLNGIARLLSEQCPNQDFIIGGNIAEDPSARKKLSECDAVILFEERKVSKHSIIQKELEILEPLDVKVLGVVVA